VKKIKIPLFGGFFGFLGFLGFRILRILEIFLLQFLDNFLDLRNGKPRLHQIVEKVFHYLPPFQEGLPFL
jgi:hypothetical protein